MLVNLFDSNFLGQSCSVACQKSRHIEYVHAMRMFDGVSLFTDEWINNPIVEQVQSRYKIGWLHEPQCLHPETYERALSNTYKFDKILTYYQPFLDEYPGKFVFAPYAGTWIDKTQWGIKPKTKLCSMLIGSKMSTNGHRIRHDIADMIEAQGFAVDFYGARGEPVNYGQETKMRVLSDYCFSIVTETCYQENLFTEWILDCFALGTIPIFWGCPNIKKFFTGSLFVFDTLDRLEKILRKISMGVWANRLVETYTHLREMQAFSITEDWIYNNVLGEYDK